LVRSGRAHLSKKFDFQSENCEEGFFGEAQIRDLAATIDITPADLVLFSTPIHLCRLLTCNKPTLRVCYEYQDYGEPTLQEVLEKRVAVFPGFLS
jgi:predicted GTPase